MWPWLAALIFIAAILAVLYKRRKNSRILPQYRLRDAYSKSKKKRMRRPKRCCGSYIPDCEGCPYFKKALFESSPDSVKKGECRFFNRDLVIKPPERHNKVIMEEDEDNKAESNSENDNDT